MKKGQWGILVAVLALGAVAYFLWIKPKEKEKGELTGGTVSGLTVKYF